MHDTSNFQQFSLARRDRHMHDSTLSAGRYTADKLGCLGVVILLPLNSDIIHVQGYELLCQGSIPRFHLLLIGMVTLEIAAWIAY